MYHDPVFRRRPAVYHEVVRSLLARGLVELRRGGLPNCGLFCVSKKDGRQRVILDARRVNAGCAPPPPVELVTSEGLSRIEATPPRDPGEGPDEGCDMWSGQLDVCDFFHRLRLPPDMQHMF